MNKLASIAGVSLLLASINSLVYAAEPTRTFISETAKTTADGTVSLDIEYPFRDNGINTGVRIGAFGGEVLLNNNNSGFATTSIGYKKVIQKDLAAYAILSYLNGERRVDSFTDIALGAAYTLNQENISFNFNAELITDDSGTLRGGETTIFVKAAAIIPLNTAKKNASLIAELAVEDNEFIDTTIAVGLRWQPSSRLTTDLIFYADNGNDDTSGIPGYVKLNLLF